MLYKYLSLLVIMSWTGWVSQAHAASITFSNKALFLAVTGATSATGPLPNLGAVGGLGATQTVGSVTLGIAAPSSGWYMGVPSDPSCGGVSGCDWTTRLPGPDIAISGSEN